MEELSKHGTLYPPEILGLTEEQVKELKLADTWGERCVPSGGFIIAKDPVGRRNGRQPTKAMQDVINNTVQEAKRLISKDLIKEGKPMTAKIVQQAIDLLKGAVMIVYPMKLPPHDVIRMEFENIEDLGGTQASLDVIDPATAQLWFCGREVHRNGKTVGNYVGNVETCKVSSFPGRKVVRTYWSLSKSSPRHFQQKLFCTSQISGDNEDIEARFRASRKRTSDDGGGAKEDDDAGLQATGGAEEVERRR